MEPGARDATVVRNILFRGEASTGISPPESTPKKQRWFGQGGGGGSGGGGGGFLGDGRMVVGVVGKGTFWRGFFASCLEEAMVVVRSTYRFGSERA